MIDGCHTRFACNGSCQVNIYDFKWKSMFARLKQKYLFCVSLQIRVLYKFRFLLSSDIARAHFLSLIVAKIDVFTLVYFHFFFYMHISDWYSFSDFGLLRDETKTFLLDMTTFLFSSNENDILIK